jgi:heme A synthase
VTSTRSVIVWLLVVAKLIAGIVVVGGYVRLTRSGLAIVEWNPVTGVIPPLSDAAWQQEFAKYQQTPEFKIVNRTMTLAGYQREVRIDAALLVAVIALQIVLGVSVVLWGVPLWLALLHQATAVVMFVMALHLNHRLAQGEQAPALRLIVEPG